MKKSRLEEDAIFRIRAYKLPEPVQEHRFHPPRRWRFDLAYPDLKIAVELEGGIWTMGRHTRGSGFVKDTEKYNQAVLDGWRVLRYTTQNMHQLIDDLKILLERSKTNEKKGNS